MFKTQIFNFDAQSLFYEREYCQPAKVALFQPTFALKIREMRIHLVHTFLVHPKVNLPWYIKEIDIDPSCIKSKWFQ